MLIGELSTQSGLSRDTIRYYEKLSLLVTQARRAGNQYKDYGQEALDRLRHIQQLKDIGFTLREIRQLLVVQEDRHPCAGLPLQLTQKIERIDRQIAVLMHFKAALLGMQGACNEKCSTVAGVPACVPQPGAPQQAARCC